ncbi:hypothetical protein SADUNF_SadunfUnG0009800 [Salix dunnii]|uniref:Uncharacterized protein n=1 Tax=Salix dunnii TaxID=1413687 RepID=A0A835IZY0_9ROSI|nr:hypothetical protein SADUNF_SadunfUnG0009800 [Salix dunnii]
MPSPFATLIMPQMYNHLHHKSTQTAKGIVMQMVATDWLRFDKREDDLAGRPDSIDTSAAFSGGATTLRELLQELRRIEMVSHDTFLAASSQCTMIEVEGNARVVELKELINGGLASLVDYWQMLYRVQVTSSKSLPSQKPNKFVAALFLLIVLNLKCIIETGEEKKLMLKKMQDLLLKFSA